jgi:hypothetical protein
VLPAIDDQALRLQLLEMVPDSIEGDPQLDSQPARRERLRPLELCQHRAALSFMAYWQAGLDHRKRDTHGANVK